VERIVKSVARVHNLAVPDENAVVALTDERWFRFLRSRGQNGRLDEVNFWRPLGRGFRAIPPGRPFFFRLKHPLNAVVGYGYFITFDLLPIREAWFTFEERNGDADLFSFASRIAEYRGETPIETMMSARPVGCIVLRGVRFLPEDEWLSWGEREEWHGNIVAYKGYDLNSGPGVLLRQLLQNDGPVELGPAFELLLADARVRTETPTVVREGQGAFRLRVLDAYGRRCSVTGERSLPVLDAAHIQPYLGPQSNHIQNGLSLRSDLHRLFDAGYVTVTPDLRFQVSRRLREDYENGREYYELDGKELLALPKREDLRPSTLALDWHANRVFRG
jgi:putative restriction endonuclease